jgi:hypothetical protein
MKKLIVTLCLIGATISSPAFAWNNGYHGYRGQGYYYNNGYNNNYWVAPAIAGVAIGALAARSYYAPPPVTYVQQPVYVQPQVYYQQPTPGSTALVGYHWQYILDPACDCYKYAMVPN